MKVGYIIGASLSEPHIDHDNQPLQEIMVCMSRSMNHLPRVCQALVPKMHVCWIVNEDK